MLLQKYIIRTWRNYDINKYKEYIKKAINNSEIEKAEFVIVNRFVFHNEGEIYLPYSGIVYPVGFVKSAEAFHFTPSLIEEGVHRGYSDEKDYAYTYLIKNELIVEKICIPLDLHHRKR